MVKWIAVRALLHSGLRLTLYLLLRSWIFGGCIRCTFAAHGVEARMTFADVANFADLHLLCNHVEIEARSYVYRF